MLSLIKSKRFLVALLMGIFGFAAGLIYDIVPLFLFTADELNYIWQEKSAELIPMFVASASLCCIISFFAYYIGDSLVNSLNIKFEKINKKGLILLLITGILVPIFIGIIDIISSNPETFSFVSVFYAMLDTTASVLYSAVMEEIWFRLCFITLMVFVFNKVFNKKTKEDEINVVDKKYIIASVIFSAFFLFVFQFNSILNQYVFNFVVLLRALLVYLIPNLLFGFIYIKHGLKWSIITHIIFIIIHLGVMPFVVTLI